MALAQIIRLIIDDFSPLPYLSILNRWYRWPALESRGRSLKEIVGTGIYEKNNLFSKLRSFFDQLLTVDKMGKIIDLKYLSNLATFVRNPVCSQNFSIRAREIIPTYVLTPHAKILLQQPTLRQCNLFERNEQLISDYGNSLSAYHSSEHFFANALVLELASEPLRSLIVEEKICFCFIIQLNI